MTTTTDRATAWSVTINNPTPTDVEQIALARQKGWTVEGQMEKGSEGTWHYQLLVKTPQTRFSTMKKQFPRAHIEVARNVAALAQYVTKEDTRQGSLPTDQEKYPSFSKYMFLVAQEIADMYASSVTDPEEYPNIKGSPLDHLDEATRTLIRQGYIVGSIAVNPSTRSQWKLFHKELYHAAIKYAPQTDRQTDSVQEEQTVDVPTDITNGHS